MGGEGAEKSNGPAKFPQLNKCRHLIEGLKSGLINVGLSMKAGKTGLLAATEAAAIPAKSSPLLFASVCCGNRQQGKTMSKHDTAPSIMASPDNLLKKDNSIAHMEFQAS
ncbi:hypothetical protein [Sodalis sp. dw_96]|uniref:hypothetical protein n=1 Tax=Sodalis sp. dw_96 TaxID=2719794 RepID=UPI001BD3ACED|nr:hypothetical protein [Sodalis sp. dw_96]